MFQTKRVYEPAAPGDGYRVLVDRLWPRGLSKENAHVDLWLKEVAPSDALRRWFGHDEDRWPEFERRYLGELKKSDATLAVLRDHARSGAVTLLYAAKDERHNNAVALVRYLNGHHSDR